MPGFQFTSIQVNKNYESAMHCDQNNLGDSYIVGVGDYRDGALYVHKRGAVACHDEWVNFDGNEPHCTLPYTGTRYTLIYFTHQSYSRLGSSQASPGRHCPSALSFCTVLLHCMAAVRRH